ncbi:30S ribosomal protein S20 [Dubosiella newyorkensis]|uniref:30S ribosomal protein S20 n=1 Tax=Dubosiella newyorkensis TaxID=1862672 RepID=UPI003F73F7A6
MEAKDKEAAVKAFSECTSKLDSAAAKGLRHKNYTIRQKSRLAKLINSIEE